MEIHTSVSLIDTKQFNTSFFNNERLVRPVDFNNDRNNL